jgi:hypothetical protein
LKRFTTLETSCDEKRKTFLQLYLKKKNAGYKRQGDIMLVLFAMQGQPKLFYFYFLFLREPNNDSRMIPFA